MATAYSRNLMEKILPKIQQYEATTGRKVSRSMLDSLFRQELEVLGEQDLRSRAVELQQKNIESDQAFRDKQLKSQEAANAISGVVGTGTAVGQMYLTNKYLNKPSGVPTTTTTPAISNADITAASGNFSSPTYAGSGINAGAQPTGPAVGGQTALSTTAAPAYDAGAMAAYDASLAEGAASGVGSTAGTTATGTGAGSAIGTAATGAGYAYAGYQLSRLLQNKVAPWAKRHLGDNWETHGFTFQPAAMAGDLVGGKAGRTIANILDPAGSILSGATSNVAEKTGTIICGELHRQGFISDRKRRYGAMYGKNVGREVYQGYLIAAEPVVERMKHSKPYTMLIAFFALPAINEIISRVNPRVKGSIFGSVVLHFGIQYCLRKYDESRDSILGEVA
jgi:hypothetical protein